MFRILAMCLALLLPAAAFAQETPDALVKRVAEIRFDNAHFQATVVLALDKRYSWPKDTSAAILTSGLLGETYIGLDAGGDDKKLAAGDRITITQPAVVLEKLIGQFLFSKAQEEPKK